MTYPDPSLAMSGQFRTGQTANPWFTVANQFMPRNLHDIIRLSRYIIMQSPTVTEVLRKYATYPITDFHIETKEAAVEEKYKRIIKSLSLKEKLHDIGFDYQAVGNCFISLYLPFERTMTCPVCGTTILLRNDRNAVYRNYQFHSKCTKPECGHKGLFKVTDTKTKDISRINLILWNQTHISTNHNPITGETDYYYKVPNDVKRKIKLGDRLMIDSMPLEIIQAVKEGKDFKFAAGHIYHMRNVSTGQSVEGVAIPPLVSMFSLIFYQACLRKANEAVATEHMTPMRVVFPTGNGATDPIAMMSLGNFTDRMETAIKKHKQDPNHFLVAPMPIGYQAISGEGRNLLVSQELAQAEQTILLGLGVSQELLSGTTNWTSSTVGLRMMENTMLSFTTQVDSLLEWIFKKISGYLGIDNVDVSLIPFKLIDDDAKRQLLFQLHGEGKVSTTTLMESLSIDANDERARMLEDAASAAKQEVEIKLTTDRAHFVAARDAGEVVKGADDYKTMLEKAQMIAQEAYGMDDGARRSFLGNLKVTDYATYLMVSKLLDEIHESESHRQQVQAEADAMGQEAAAIEGQGPGSSSSQAAPTEQEAATGQQPASAI